MHLVLYIFCILLFDIYSDKSHWITKADWNVCVSVVQS